jgi:hypothetical protein
MFEKLANFRLFQPWRRTPQAYRGVAANDNVAIIPRPGGQRRIRPPELTCHWSLVEGGTRLICCWQARPQEPCEDMRARRAKHDAARKRSNHPSMPPVALTVRT